MAHLNVEFKARVVSLAPIRAQLVAAQATLQGTDRQTDTYFEVATGRLKLRQGSIENALIHFERAEVAGLKTSKVRLAAIPSDAAQSLLEVLSAALKTVALVQKQREIWWLGNCKFHLDTVQGLGHFVELEAIDYAGTLGEAHLHQQCADWLARLGIGQDQLMAGSYAELLAQASGQ